MRKRGCCNSDEPEELLYVTSVACDTLAGVAGLLENVLVFFVVSSRLDIVCVATVPVSSSVQGVPGVPNVYVLVDVRPTVSEADSSLRDGLCTLMSGDPLIAAGIRAIGLWSPVSVWSYL